METLNETIQETTSEPKNNLENLQSAPIKTSENNNFETSSTCKKIKFMFLYIILGIIILNILFLIFYSLPIPDSIKDVLINIISVITYFLPLAWIFFIPIYAFLQKKLGKIEAKCFKGILIIWALPIVIPLIAFGGCLLIFGLFSI